MKKIFGLSVFVIFFLALFLPRLNADSEAPPPSGDLTISMDFKDADLKDVLKVFSMQSGLNFMASEAVQDRKITLYLDKVPIGKAMDKLFKANNLSYDMDKEANIFLVKDWGKPEIEMLTQVFFLKYATVSSSSVKEEMSKNLAGQAAKTGTTTQSAETSSAEDKGKWKTEDSVGITSAIKKLLSKSGSLIEDFRTNSLIVTDLPSRMPVIAQTIAALDISVPQVILEVEMLDVSKGLVDKIGVDWPEALAKFDGTLLQRATAFPFGHTKFANTSHNGATITTTSATPSGWNNVSWPTNSFGPGIVTVLGSELILYFLRTQTDTKTLARPKILTLNNEPAEIKITTQEVVGEKRTSEQAGGGTQVTVEAERYETGVSLRVTPQINLDTGEITMFIVPTVTEATRSTTTSAFGAIYFNPEVRSTKSIVKIKDGQTVILGGLIRKEFSQSTQKLPVLGDIPLLGKLFQWTYKDKDRDRELLVFITPHIVRDTNLSLLQAKKTAFPEREQAAAPIVNRDALMNDYLNNCAKRIAK